MITTTGRIWGKNFTRKKILHAVKRKKEENFPEYLTALACVLGGKKKKKV